MVSNEGCESQSNISSNNQQKTCASTRRASSVENLRLLPTNHALNRNIQRCAVSRRISVEKDLEEIIMPTSINSKDFIGNIESITQPLRAFHMVPTINQESPRKSSSVPRSSTHQLIVEKTFASRTIITNVLPSTIPLKHRKNN